MTSHDPIEPLAARPFGFGVDVGVEVRVRRAPSGGGARRRARPEGRDPGTSDIAARIADLHAAALAHEASQAGRPASAAFPHVAAFRPHPCEEPPHFRARVVRALSHGASVLLITDRHGTDVAIEVAEDLARVVGGERVGSVRCLGLDALRSVAAHPRVLLDIVAPDAFATGLRGSLARIRDAAADAEEDEGDGRARGRDPWFGHGIVDEPPAAIRVHSPAGRRLLVRPCDARATGATAQRDARPADAAADPEILRVERGETKDAAHRAVELAFGAGARCGFAASAVSRIDVDPRLFASFTEDLLARLDAVESTGGLVPPDWALEGECAAALVAARRIGLDEGATLIHEHRPAGARGDGGTRSGASLGFVFTNVEPRMRLGNQIRALGGLVLLRDRDPMPSPPDGAPTPP